MNDRAVKKQARRIVAGRPVSSGAAGRAAGRPLYHGLEHPDDRVRVGGAECAGIGGRMSPSRVDDKLRAFSRFCNTAVYVGAFLLGWNLGDWFWPIVFSAVAVL